ncbi:leucyl/phenylalanyl-tRNA--protein transferase [Faucicola boevrei]|uniref:leucyl/phenylalanyl-tRNA--protein transferase n=1 Tax=Faucicola boevrei TaxID=346665 RepID=UPI000368245B|nr:leucyl/phenylalanyl-tRNA--protein transferase [Moraxella boevrei]
MLNQYLSYPCDYDFPNPLFSQNKDGLIAIGADLSPKTLRYAYAHGFFPWFDDESPIMWWSPNPRCVIYPHTFSPSKTLARKLKNSNWTFTLNRDFSAVINACSEARSYSDGTWITGDMINAYSQLHHLGDAHSVEIWQDKQLIGGLYGIKLGQAFFGESMFHKVTDASKVAFFALMKICQLSDFAWVDCQLPNAHLLSLGANVISREQFLTDLPKQIHQASCDWSAIFEQKFTVKDLLLNCPIINKSNQLHLKQPS